MKRDQEHGKCERCGCTFDTADGYASIDYAQVAADLPLANSEEFHIDLCNLCECAFNGWLDSGI